MTATTPTAALVTAGPVLSGRPGHRGALRGPGVPVWIGWRAQNSRSAAPTSWCAHRVHGWSGSRPPAADSASYDELGDPHAYRGLRPEVDTAWVLVFEATSLQLSHEM
jgi:hypothetical protein